MHTYGVMRYKGDSAPLTIYTLKRDDMPSLSAWHKKTLVLKNESFLGPTLKMEPVWNPDFLLFQLFIAIFSYLLYF